MRILFLAFGLIAAALPAQLASRSPTLSATAAKPHRQRLILKDGSYQIVMSYTVAGARVRYLSAERGGETEEIPLDLVDLPATEHWEKQHAAPAEGEARPAPELDPELVKEEAERAALAPEIAPDLRLAPEANLLALDTFRGGPELVPLDQTTGEQQSEKGHRTLKGIINPASAAHQIVVLKGEKALVQMHVSEPVFYIKLDDALPDSGPALTVDTHGASAAAPKPGKHTAASSYVVVRVDVRQDARVVTSFEIAALGTDRHQEDVFETDAVTLPGGHWLKLTPREPLLVGEYALVEVLGERSLNLGVWDFGVHPTAPENRDVLKPEKRRPVQLERRPVQLERRPGR